MATEGPRFPGTTASLSNAGSSENAEAWVNPGNIVSDNGSEASITAATFDTPDISQLLVASNFGFTLPAGATINGITVEVERRDGAIGSASDNRIQLAKGTTFASLVGNNKAATTTDWPTNAAVATYGANNDLWGTTWTGTEIRASSFAVMLSVQADSANTDVFVDFIRVTVDYTDNSVTVTPTTASLTTATFAPTVTATQNQLVTPSAASLTLSTFAPTVTATDHQRVTPDTASLSLSTFAPTVTVESQGITVTPGTASLTTATFAPTVTASDHKTATPTTASLSLATFAPTVTASDHKTATPTTQALSLTAFAPNVVASDHKVVTPATATLSLSTFAPSVGQPVTVTPTTAALSLAAFNPSVVLTDHVLVTPELAALSLTGFAPTVTGDPSSEVPIPEIVVVRVWAERGPTAIVMDGPSASVRSGGSSAEVTPE